MIAGIPMEEVLLGRPLLDPIWFNSTDHLAWFQSIVNDNNMDELEAAKLRRATSK